MNGRVPRALVTGSAGFVGRNMAHHLDAAGYYVTGVDIVDGVDALDVFRNGSQRFDLVIHAAAVVGGRSMIEGRPLELAAIDLELDSALWRWALRTRPGRVVYFSSSAAYPVVYQSEGIARHLDEGLIDHSSAYMGRPDNTYGLVKLVGERLALDAAGEGLAVTVVRPFSGYGPDQALDYPFPTFIDRARRGLDPFPIWGTGRQVRDFVHIDDVVAAVLRLVELGVDVPVNIGTGRPTSFDDLAEMVASAVGYRPELDHHLDQPAGVDYRVADVSLLHTFYEPKVDLETGIERALR